MGRVDWRRGRRGMGVARQLVRVGFLETPGPARDGPRQRSLSSLSLLADPVLLPSPQQQQQQQHGPLAHPSRRRACPLVAGRGLGWLCRPARQLHGVVGGRPAGELAHPLADPPPGGRRCPGAVRSRARARRRGPHQRPDELQRARQGWHRGPRGRVEGARARRGPRGDARARRELRPSSQAACAGAQTRQDADPPPCCPRTVAQRWDMHPDLRSGVQLGAARGALPVLALRA